MTGRWICSLCERSGTGGGDGYHQHYVYSHYQLEAERIPWPSP